MLGLRRRSRIRGHVDRVSCTAVTGWVMHRDAPALRLDVELRLRERVIATGRADRPRPDLRASGIGDGCYGFTIALPPDFEPSDRHHLRFVETATGSEFARDPGAQAEPAVAPWSALFDAEHYLRQVPDAERAAARRDPAAHFREHGWRGGRDPHPLFDTAFYLRQIGETPEPDPITHFLAEGRARRLSPHPFCDVALYEVERPDVRAARIHPLLHFQHFGEADGTPLTPFFDGSFYRCQGRTGTVGVSPLVHYLTQGWRDGERPHPDFDPQRYRRLLGLDRTVEPLRHLHGQLANQRRTANEADGTVLVSIVLLNANDAVRTLQALVFLRHATTLETCEIVVVDRGSSARDFMLLSHHAGDARIVRLAHDVGEGEARNIGAEAARGEILVFLEPGTFVATGWLETLVAALEPGVAMAQSREGDVLALRADSFRRVLGYDLAFDPGRSDADLRLRLGLAGGATREVAALPIERPGDRDTDEGAATRVAFEARWGAFLAGRSDGVAERALIPPLSAAVPIRDRRIALYSRYPLTPGGGERYLLSLAAALRADHAAVLYTPDRHSQMRLATLSRELDLPCDHIAIRPWAERRGTPDVFVCMSNEILPSVAPFGRVNLFLCQFPFPMTPEARAEQWGNLAGYDAMLVYSRFAGAHAARAADELGLTLPPCHVLAPPVPQVEGASEGPDPAAPFRILNVGRFSPDGHCKRQDVMIDAFADLAARSPRPVELHLAGALGTATRDHDYVEALRRAAQGLPVTFHCNAGGARIHALYRAASVYWHMTGARDDVRAAPERFEHFGITIGEAMSAGVIPVSLKHGGPAEIVTDGIDGLLVADQAELAARTLALMELEVARVWRMRAAAQRRAADFAFTPFSRELRIILDTRNTMRNE